MLQRMLNWIRWRMPVRAVSVSVVENQILRAELSDLKRDVAYWRLVAIEAYEAFSFSCYATPGVLGDLKDAKAKNWLDRHTVVGQRSLSRSGVVWRYDQDKENCERACWEKLRNKIVVSEHGINLTTRFPNPVSIDPSQICPECKRKTASLPRGTIVILDGRPLSLGQMAYPEAKDKRLDFPIDWPDEIAVHNPWCKVCQGVGTISVEPEKEGRVDGS
jgi:hypothetical protein